MAHIESLLQDLAHGTPDLRSHAAIALGRLADPRAVAALYTALRDPSVEVRQTATQALTGIGESAVPALCYLDATAHRSRMSQELVEVVMGVGPRAIAPLVRILKETRKPIVLNVASTVIYPLLHLAGIGRREDPTQRQIKDRAVDTLGVLGTEASRPLVELLSHKDHYLAERAGATLVVLGASVVPLLIDKLRTGPWRARCSAAHALQRIGDPQAILRN